MSNPKIPQTAGEILLPLEEAKKIASLVGEFTQIGCAGDILEVMTSMNLSLGGWPPLSDSDRKFLAGPIICHARGENGWGPDYDGHPIHKFSKQIRAERAEIVLGLLPGMTVGPTEIMCVIWSATMDGPLSKIPADIYMWAACQALARKTHAGQTAGDIQDMLFEGTRGIERLTNDLIIYGPEYGPTYRGLCNDIRRKVEGHKRPARQSVNDGGPIHMAMYQL